MFTVQLKATNEIEQKVLNYLELNASDALVDKINAGAKTLAGALEYAKSEAKKLAKGEGCISVEDQTVFGWIIHFFEEDDVKEGAKKPTVRGPASVVKKAEKAKAASKLPRAVRRKPAAKGEAVSEPVPVDVGQMSMIESLFKG